MIRASFEIEPCADPEKRLYDEIDSRLGGIEKTVEIRKRSVDARRGRNRFVYSVDISLADKSPERDIAASLGGAVAESEEEYVFPSPRRLPEKRPVVAGFGPAGIFAALCLARAGLKPIVLERGRPVDERVKDVADFFSGKGLDENSNIQFGEGGAGAFSDGKLNTLVRDKSFRGGFVLRELVKAGAPREILYNSRPHIGTDLLRGVVKNLRREIISLGGEVRFSTKLTDITLDGEKLSGVAANGEIIAASALFLATGQSAEEILKTLHSRGAELEKKPFSVGFRIEHPQSLIDRAQYGEGGDLRYLPPAEYKLFSHTSTGRTVYSFCMCPGGSVVAAASEAERLVTNGMSFHARDGKNANSAILCEVLPGDLGIGLFDGFRFREKLERGAFLLGGGGFAAPFMTLGELLGTGAADPAVVPSYPTGVRRADFTNLFGGDMVAAFREAVADFAKKVRGFDLGGAVLTAAETRTSSPLRIVRFDDRQSNIKGIFPLGEGAGHAGGIMSAAIDGVRSAEEYVLSL